MSGLFPLEPEITVEPDERSYINIAGERASTVLPTLASTTARRMLIQLHKKPGTASDLANSVETSVQNALYHLGSLQEAGLVEIVDTWYSSRGVKMKVYAPISKSLVLFAGSKEDFDDVKRATKSPPEDMGSTSIRTQ